MIFFDIAVELILVLERVVRGVYNGIDIMSAKGVVQSL